MGSGGAGRHFLPSLFSNHAADAAAPSAYMPATPNPTVAADISSYSKTITDSQRAAITAGGTIFGRPEDNRRKIGTDPTQPRKSLLGL